MKHKAYQGDDEDPNSWGVETKDGTVAYDGMFSEPVAKRIAELESRRHPPKDWHATEEILIREGLLPNS